MKEQEFKENDKVYFINSDGERCEGVIEKRQFDCTHADTGETLEKGTLFFWNNSFEIEDFVKYSDLKHV